MSCYIKKPKTGMHLCDCGNPASRKKDNSWQCNRCLAINIDDYRRLTAGVRPAKIIDPSANQLLTEWKVAND